MLALQGNSLQTANYSSVQIFIRAKHPMEKIQKGVRTTTKLIRSSNSYNLVLESSSDRNTRMKHRRELSVHHRDLHATFNTVIKLPLLTCPPPIVLVACIQPWRLALATFVTNNYLSSLSLFIQARLTSERCVNSYSGRTFSDTCSTVRKRVSILYR